MPVLDDESNSIIVRIVYAGPPMAGKTESIQSLAELLLGDSRAEGAVFSPGEATNRTLYFDWLDYSGGLFKGRKVRCQIVTVPGQKALTERRQLILKSADAVVFVADSSPDRFDEAVDYLKEVQSYTDKPDNEAPVGIILQANKRDLPDALSLEEITSRLAGFSNLSIIESAATAGRGVRETFVKSVGLSLERAQLLMSSGSSLDEKLDFEGGKDLLAAIEAHEAVRYEQPEPEATKLASVAQEDKATQSSRLIKIISASTTPGVTTQQPAVNAKVNPAENKSTTENELTESISKQTSIDEPQSLPPPWLPDANLQAGNVWPPVAGRLILHEIASNQSTPKHQDKGTWTLAAGDNWLLASQSDQLYDDLNNARRQLLEHVRAHRSVDEFISESRCLALAPANEKQWRIWQIVRREKSLADELRNALQDLNPVVIADKLFQIAGYLLHATASIRILPLLINTSLQSCSLVNNKAVYSGFIYTNAINEETPDPMTPASITELIRHEFGLPIHTRLDKEELDVPLILTRFKQIQGAHPDNPVIEALSTLFIGH